MSLSTKLKELRIKNNLSLQELADSVGASKAHIWELETGRSKNPSVDLVRRISERFKITVSELLGESPQGTEEDQDIVAMYRELKELEEVDRETIRLLMERLRALKKG
ncbi:helix-turn-helix transcriptional regulator [Methyloligella sp. 2.7D]|uniref:helix-turn-helix domain-containing protein n=1 Tax=unclassified Methyloligella TaxID=2625955 RepID=UPI00157C0CF8|nr:helix-turn-helix transcriptional regulator [Methyloligella sp. GL2]QKP76432.1 helix-turn-helix transcriptional regulator [Methyloligella sp. GL2]